jgi:hypothetical protein
MFKNIKTSEQLSVKKLQLRIKQAEANRKNAYISEADPLFFKAQRNEATLQEWKDKISEIKIRFPKEQQTTLEELEQLTVNN